jgi:membrane protein YdbS with pleckstrin-like domain
MRILGVLVIIWLVIGAIAAGQRHYYSKDAASSCASASTIVVTIVAGPLNYFGINPRVKCQLPQPSK